MFKNEQKRWFETLPHLDSKKQTVKPCKSRIEIRIQCHSAQRLKCDIIPAVLPGVSCWACLLQYGQERER